MSRRGRLLALGLPTASILALASFSLAQDRGSLPSFEVCRHPELDGALSRKVDLGAPGRERRAMEKNLLASLAALQGKPNARKDESYDTGIPGCTRNREREIVLAQALPSVFRDRSLYFVRLGKGGNPFTGRLAAVEKDAFVFVLACPSLAAAGDLARATGARVSIGTAELADKFGVRCAESLVRVSGDGKTIRIEERVP